MRRLYRAGNLTEAYLILHMLEREAVSARVLNEHAQGALGEIPFTHAGPEVWVTEDVDYERARVLVVRFESLRNIAGVRRCNHCGEENPMTFELCWHCGEPITK